MANRRTDGRSGQRGPGDRRWEHDANKGAYNGSAPAAALGRQLVLVEMDLALLVLGDHADVVGADETERVELLDDLIVGDCGRLVRIGADIDEDCLWLCHVVPPVVIAGRSW